MPLTDAFDHFFREPGKLTGSDGEERHLRFELLRGRVEERLQNALGLDEHSLAVPIMAGYLERALSLYVLGFFESCILEVHARVGSLARALAGSDEDDLEALLARDAVKKALAPGGDEVAGALRLIARRRRDLRLREEQLALSVLGGSIARGRASGGFGAVIAESPTSQRMRWGSDLHDALALAVRAACLLIEGARAAQPRRVGATGGA
jgi:hypothetical protein